MHPASQGTSLRASMLVATVLVATVMLLAPADLVPYAGPQEPDTTSAQEQPTDQPSPLEADLKEKVQVRILQLEVTAWPKSGEVRACHDLTRDDFEVRIGGQPRDILAADRLGTLGEPALDSSGSAPTGASSAAEQDSAASVPMRYVIVFDTWHLDLWWQICGRTTPLAFSWVREMLQDRFQPGDRVMLATLSNLPQFYTPWLDNRETALQALEEMEIDRRILVPHRDHTTDYAWMAGWKLLLESLGNVPGRKQLIYLGDDWRPEWSDGVVLGIPAIAARAQKNHVLIESIDTIAACRNHPVFRDINMTTPQIIANLAEQSGGHLFQAGQTVSSAVATLRQMQSCRFLLSVEAQAKDRRKNGLRIHAVMLRPGFRLAAPERVEDPRRGATEEEKLQALFLLPSLERGLFARADLWPVRPTGKKNRWDALLLAHLQKTNTARWPLDIQEILVGAVVYQGSKVFGEYQGVLREEELATFLEADRGLSFSFPVTIPSGALTVAITVRATGSNIGATSRTRHVVPQPPQPGEAHPWFVSDRAFAIGDRLSLAPSVQDSFLPMQPPLVLGFGCPPVNGDRSIGQGKLVRQGGGGERQVGVRWLDQDDQPDADPAACGWLIGEIEAPLVTGLWDFYPPSFGEGNIDTPTLTFRMHIPGEAAAAPADAAQR